MRALISGQIGRQQRSGCRISLGAYDGSPEPKPRSGAPGMVGSPADPGTYRMTENDQHVESELLARPDVMTAEHMLEVLRHYYEHRWNGNKDVLKTLRNWRGWPVVIRMPDLAVDYTVVIEEGRVESVTPGTPAKARLLVVMLSETMNRIYYEETTAAIESIAGRVKIKGNETERRRMLAAISYLTW